MMRSRSGWPERENGRGNGSERDASKNSASTVTRCELSLAALRLTMLNAPFKLTALFAVIAGIGLQTAWAADTITIKVPRHAQLTHVQRLNREGVMAVEKHDYAKAADFFFKAYLYDPADPFTLNNLGYISELQGQLDRADKFYKLAAEQGCTANVDLSNVKRLQGIPMNTAFAGLQEAPMRVNRINVDAMRMLSENRGFEAAAVLEQARSLDTAKPVHAEQSWASPTNPIGDYDSALRYYAAAANSRSVPLTRSLSRAIAHGRENR